MEAEYIAASKASKEAVWLKNFLSNLEVVPNMDELVTLYCDNSSVVVIFKEPRSYKREKYMEKKVSFDTRDRQQRRCARHQDPNVG